MKKHSPIVSRPLLGKLNMKANAAISRAGSIARFGRKASSGVGLIA